ncbi:unnamed protein product [Rhodiola kirilowii]
MAPISRLTATARALLRRDSVGSRACRCFSAASDASRHGDELDIGGLSSGARWVVTGEAGMKKDVYAERLSKLLQVPHISMRSLVQEERGLRSSPYKQILSAAGKGKRLPEDIKFGLLSKRLEHGQAIGESGFILTGVPRNKSQAEILDGIIDISLVINFKRLVRTSQQQSIHGCSWLDIVSMPKSQRQASRLRSSTITGNPRDEKLRMYAEEGKEVELHYRRQQKLLNLQLTGTPEETWQGFIASLCLQHMDTVNLQRLTA